MSGKTKLLSLLLLILLTLPFLTLPNSGNGNVLGAIDDRSGSIDYTSGEIAGGVVDSKGSSEDLIETEEIKGKAVLNKNLESGVASNKFSLATGITVTHNDNKLNLVVADTETPMPEEAILVVDADTFQKLGGNIESQEAIEVSIKED